MSLRVLRWDTGGEAEIPEEALRWGPDTRLGTCRADLLQRPENRALPSDVTYLLPFEGAKWAVRVTLAERAGAEPGDVFRHSPRTAWKPAQPPRLSQEIKHLGDLLEAAGEALRAEEPDALGEALELLAEIMPKLSLTSFVCLCCGATFMDRGASDWHQAHAPAHGAPVPSLGARVRAFLERQTSAEIRREWKGAGGPILSGGDVDTLGKATALLRRCDSAVADALCDLADRLVFWRRKGRA